MEKSEIRGEREGKSRGWLHDLTNYFAFFSHGAVHIHEGYEVQTKAFSVQAWG